ncbi:MAG: hypothetical protein RLZZ214_2324 [Verrucomicrobiota bacterium]|jgi:transposase InsO family protein
MRETRAGYRGVRRHLVREGWDVNLKRVHRIWKKEGLRVPPKAHKQWQLCDSENGTQRLQAERINQVWSYDFVFDQTGSGGRFKWLPVLDEFSRECLTLEVERSMTSGDVIEISTRSSHNAEPRSLFVRKRVLSLSPRW